jgi:hypothetical protein
VAFPPPKKSSTHKPPHGASRSFPRGGMPRPGGGGGMGRGGMPPGLPPIAQLAAQFVPDILAKMMQGGGGGGMPPGGAPPQAFTGNGPPQPPAQGAIGPPQDELDMVQQGMGQKPY